MISIIFFCKNLNACRRPRVGSIARGRTGRPRSDVYATGARLRNGRAHNNSKFFLEINKKISMIFFCFLGLFNAVLKTFCSEFFFAI